MNGTLSYIYGPQCVPRQETAVSGVLANGELNFSFLLPSRTPSEFLVRGEVRLKRR
jgi:hypothetical protein